jgi:large subunit ribosomal protein L20
MEGQYGARSRLFRPAHEALLKSQTYAYRDRRRRKRDFRRLWIQRINAASRQHDLSYNQFMHGLKQAGVALDRKVLADIAVAEPEIFAELAAIAREGAQL